MFHASSPIFWWLTSNLWCSLAFGNISLTYLMWHSPGLCVCVQISLFIRTPIILQQVPTLLQYHHVLSSYACLQTRSHSEVLKARTSTFAFTIEGNNSTPNSPKLSFLLPRSTLSFTHIPASFWVTKGSQNLSLHTSVCSSYLQTSNVLQNSGQHVHTPKTTPCSVRSRPGHAIVPYQFFLLSHRLHFLKINYSKGHPGHTFLITFE